MCRTAPDALAAIAREALPWPCEGRLWVWFRVTAWIAPRRRVLHESRVSQCCRNPVVHLTFLSFDTPRYPQNSNPSPVILNG